MSTAILRTFEVASEATFGSLINGIPSTAALTFGGLEFDRASVNVFGGESELVEDNTALLGPGGMPPEVSASWDAVNTQRVARQTGEISVTARIKPWGAGNAAFSDANDLPLVQLWASGLDAVDHGGAAVSTSSFGANNGVIDFGAPPGLTDGEVVLAVIGNCVYANRVTDVTGNEATFLHFWPSLPDEIRRGLNFRVPQGNGTGSTGASVAIRGRSLDAEYVAYGCRLQSLSINNDNGILLAEMTIRPAIIITDVSPGGVTLTDTPRIAAPTAVLRGVALRRTDGDTGPVAGPAAPASLASTTVPFELEGLTVAIENTLQPVGAGCPAIGMSDMEVAGTTVTMEYVSRAPASADERDLLDRVCRGIALAGAPVNDGTTALNGWGISIPAASLSADANITAEDDGLLQQTRSYEARFYAGDSTVGAVSQYNTVLFLGGT